MNIRKNIGILLSLSTFLGGCRAQEEPKRASESYKEEGDILISDDENLLPLRKSQRPKVTLIPSRQV